MRTSNRTKPSISTTDKPIPVFSWDDIDSEIICVNEEIPPNALTTTQLSERWKVSVDTASDHAKRMIRDGKMKRGQKRSMTPSGRNSVMWHYWPT